jgi:OOP family OmpA-OmpF porin
MAKKHDVCFTIISDAKTSDAQKRVRDMAKANACSRVVPFDQFVRNPNYITGALYLVKSSDEVVTRTEQKVVGVKVDNVLFDFDKADIRPEFHAALDDLGQYLTDNPDSFALMAGFTDNVGSDDYNVDLSFQRALSVAGYLTTKFGVDRKQLVIFGYGAANPAESNQSEEGRAQNRRVEIAVGI